MASPDSPISKPPCNCGHFYELHQPECMQCGCFPYDSVMPVTITDMIQEEVKLIQPPKKKEELPLILEPTQVVKVWCPECHIVETLSINMSSPFHRHDNRLVLLRIPPKVQNDKGVSKSTD